MAVLSPASFAPATTGAMGIGYREDLSKDALTLLDPHDSYFVKKASRVDCALRHDWLTDNLPSLSATLRTPLKLSTEWTFSTTVARKRFYNQCEYLDWEWKIAQAAEIAAKKGLVAGGINSEIANEIERQMKYGGKEMEQLCLSAQAQVVDDDSAVAGKLSGFFDSVQWNAYTGSSPALAWTADTLANQGAFDAYGQAELEAILLRMFNNGAVGPITAYMPASTHATWAASFTGRPGYQVVSQEKDHAIDNQVFTYYSRTGIGQVDFVSDRTLNANACVALINHNFIAIGEFSPIKVWEIDPNNQRNRAGAIDTYITLVDKNPQAHGRVYTTGVTPS